VAKQRRHAAHGQVQIDIEREARPVEPETGLNAAEVRPPSSGRMVPATPGKRTQASRQTGAACLGQARIFGADFMVTPSEATVLL